MRLVRFDDPTSGTGIDLHPLLTVISGLDAPVRERLIATLAALPTGAPPVATGTLEVHGVFLDLTADNLALLELDSDVDPVLRATDLPGSEEDEPDVDDDAEVQAARAVVDDIVARQATGASVLEALLAEIDELVATRAEVAAELDAARADIDAFALAGLKVARQELADLIAARAAAPPATPADEPGFEDGGQAGSDAAAGTVAVADPVDGGDQRAIEARLDELISESWRLKQEIKQIDRLATVDAGTVRSALDRLRSELAARHAADVGPDHDDATPGDDATPADDLTDVNDGAAAPQVDAAAEIDDPGTDGPPEPPGERVPAAAALADEIAELDQSRAAAERDVAGARQHVSELSARRDAAHDELRAAESALRTPELDPAVIEELERTHDEIFELDGRAPRIGGGKHRKRMGELRELETRLLGQLGFDTWSSYVMGVSSADAEAERLRRYEVAKATYELAEDELARALATPLPELPDFSEFTSHRRQLLARAADLLGREPGDDPVTELRHHRVGGVAEPAAPAPAAVDAPDDPSTPEPTPAPASGPYVADTGAASGLRTALAHAGVELADPDQPDEDLALLADGWLSGLAAAETRRSEAVAAREATEAEIAELATRLESLPGQAAAVTIEPTTEPAPEPAAESAAGTAPDSARGAGDDGGEGSDPDAGPLDPSDLDASSFPDDAEVQQAAAKVAACEARVERHRTAAERSGTLQFRDDELALRHTELTRLVAEHEAVRAADEAALPAAQRALERAESALADRRAAAERAAARARSRVMSGNASVEALEWYVLARLASQRAVSFVGSVPLVIDDAFAAWSVDELLDVLVRLERMSEVIQIVLVTDDADLIAWAQGLGADHAAVIDLAPAAF